MNNITTVGRLGADPVLSYTSQGKGYTSFNLADDTQWGSGENRVKETTWIRCTIWNQGENGKQAENAAEYMKKGNIVQVEGRLVPDRESGGPKLFTGQDGVMKASFELKVSNWRNWSPKPDSN